jgi:hypothetical protein
MPAKAGIQIREKIKIIRLATIKAPEAIRGLFCLIPWI